MRRRRRLIGAEPIGVQQQPPPPPREQHPRPFQERSAVLITRERTRERCCALERKIQEEERRSQIAELEKRQEQAKMQLTSSWHKSRTRRTNVKEDREEEACKVGAKLSELPFLLLPPMFTALKARGSQAGLLLSASLVCLLLSIGSLGIGCHALSYSSSSSSSSSGWQQQSGGQQSIAGLQQSMAQLLQVFNGNESQQLEANHFKLMERAGDFLLLGARNVVYNLSLSTMREQRRLEWPSSEEDVKMCRMKGKSPEQCQNYIRVVKLQAPNTLYICGTNAYKPRCRTYLVTANAYELVTEAPGEGACPYQENQNVTSLVVDGELYSATAAQFSGIDGLIHRPPLRTEQFNPKQLNSPNFVSSFKYGEHVYFLFRESAIEYTNCGKAIYSRIARVCINDSGGQTRANRERWTSFVKARLNCSIPGEFPFYFDEIQASTQIVSSPSMASSAGSQQQQQYFGQQQPAAASGGLNPSTDLLYAVFTTPSNSIGGSAVCAYRMSDVLAAFDGPFKAQADGNSNWLPVQESRVPQPRPGSCVNDSKQLPDENINFIKDNPLMDTAVEAIWSQPLIMMASINFRFTQIAVDAQVETQLVLGANQMRTDVIFVATDDGRVFKLINTHHLVAAANSASGASVMQPPASAAAQRYASQQTPYSQPYYMSQRQQQFDQLQQYPHQQQQQQFAPLRSHQHQHQPLQPIAAAQVLASAPMTNTREPLPDVSSGTVVIEELHLFDSRTPILSLLIYYPPPPQPPLMLSAGDEPTASEQQQQMHSGFQYPKLVVVSGKQVKAVPLSRCERALSCADCLALYDPYCAWDTRQQACLALGRSIARSQYSSSLMLNQQSLRNNNNQQQQLGSSWFPPNNLNLANNHTLAWWSQCPANSNGQPAQQQAVGAPYRSLFSSHFQVPSRFDYQSGHHLSHTALVALSAAPLQPPSPQQQQQQGQQLAPTYRQQQPLSECLTFCGGLHTPLAPASSSSSFASSSIISPPSGGTSTSDQSSSAFMSNCADYVQQHYIGNLQPGSAFIGGSIVGAGGIGSGQQQVAGNSSENFYFAVIICAVSGLILGLIFGFTLGRNTRKHDSSICSSTFDETNLYMASTGSHHGANLFAQLQQQQQRQLHHPLLQQAGQNATNGGGGVTAALLSANGIRPSMQSNGPGNNHQHLYDSASVGGNLLQQQQHQQDQGNYGNYQQHQQLLNQVAPTSMRTGALPPVPSLQQQQQAPLINTNSTPATLINHSQLTPNSLNGSNHHSGTSNGMLSGSSTSSTNTSSTSATVPASEHHQLYLNQQQLLMQQPNLHQRSFTGGSANTTTTNNSSMTKGTQSTNNRSLVPDSNGKLSNGVHKNAAAFLQQQQQQQQQQMQQLQQQQQNKIYL